MKVDERRQQQRAAFPDRRDDDVPLGRLIEQFEERSASELTGKAGRMTGLFFSAPSQLRPPMPHIDMARF